MTTNLFEQEEFYRTAFFSFVNTAVDAMILIDSNSTIQLFNPAAGKMFGYSQEEILGVKITVLMPDAYREAHNQYVQNYKETGKKKAIGTSREVLGQRKDNSVFPLELSMSEMEMAGEKYFTGVIHDISHLKQTETEVIEKNKLLDTIFKIQRKFIATTKSNEVFNELLTEILNVTGSEYGFIGEIKHAEDGQPYLKTRAVTNISWDEASRKLYEENEDEGLEFRNLDSLLGYTIKTGERVIDNNPSSHPKSRGLPRNHPSLNAYMGIPLFSGSKLIGMLGISNRKEGYDEAFAEKMQPMFATCSNFIQACRIERARNAAEASLHVSEERLRRSQHYANIGTWDWTIATGELHWSDWVAPLFGYPEGGLGNTYDNFLNSVHPDDRDMVVAAINACVDEDKSYDIEHRCIWPDQSVRWLAEKGDVQKDESGKAVRMLGVVQDITERKEAEINIVKAKEEAERANKAKSQFLSRMSHELRTPMNAILGFAQLLELEKDLTDTQKQRVSEIAKAGYHLLDLINEVLDLAKIEAGKLIVSTGPVGIKDVFTDCIKLIMPVAAKYKITINYHADGCENFMVTADKTRLKQVILNLLSNAIKYNKPDGSVSIEFQVNNNKSLKIKIIDTGMGISKKLHSGLFTAFNRLEAEGSSTEGVGIGLVITKNLVELMHGTINFESRLGEGSSFWIELPLVLEDGHSDF